MISEKESAMYPFKKKVIELVDLWNLTGENLVDPFYESVVNRAEERVSQAIQEGEASIDLENFLDEFLSFPVANMFVRIIGDDYLDRRYSLSEAVRATNLLSKESDESIIALAITEFGWDINSIDLKIDNLLYKFELHFIDYLINSFKIKDIRWKLINRRMKSGYVPLTKNESIRLLQEEIQRSIYSLVSKHTKIKLPKLLEEKVESLKKILGENRPSYTDDNLPREVVRDAFPPCIKHAFDGLLSGRRAGHMERFALTSFLINVGMKVDDIVKLFTSVTDFDEQFTRYQIEHIAGIRGSRTKYTPPTCSTLKTHGVCFQPDDICKYVRHPLSYYRKKI
jgi:DNA primase large subunit